MKSQLLAEHRRLDVLFVETRNAFRATDGFESALKVFRELREALETHFDQEDRLYYPALSALRPDLKSALQTFAAEHDKFRSQFGDIDAVLARRDFEAGGRVIELLAEEFRRHEVGEESMLRSLDRELEDAD